MTSCVRRAGVLSRKKRRSHNRAFSRRRDAVNLSRILSLYVSVVLGASGAVYSRERLGASPFVLVCVSLAMYPGARRRWDHDLATSGRLAFEPVGDRVRALYNNNNNCALRRQTCKSSMCTSDD